MVMTSLLLSFAYLAAVACGGGEQPGDGQSGEKVTYSLSVKTEAGKPVSRAIVRVYLNGEYKTMDISNSSGEISFSLAPAEYTLVVDETSLAPGYTPLQSYTTTAAGGNIDVIIDIGVIDGVPPADEIYAVGDLIYDFTLREVESNQSVTLSEVLAQKDMVLLNFCYEECAPCRSEFPYIIEAYNEYSDDVAIISIDPIDGPETALGFKKEMGIPFYFCTDPGGGAVTNYFNFGGYPNNVIIDRYGVICMIDGSAADDAQTVRGWFESYIGDDYVQA